MKKIVFAIIIIFLTFIKCNIVTASPGCCSSHGGESGCAGGYTICSDGWKSSCICDGTSNYNNNYSHSSTNYNNNTSVNSDAQLYFFWLPILIIVVIFIIYNVTHDTEYEKFKKNVVSKKSKYQTKKQATICIKNKNDEIVEMYCWNVNNIYIKFLNVSQNYSAYSLYVNKFFNDEMIACCRTDKIKIYDPNKSIRDVLKINKKKKITKECIINNNKIENLTNKTVTVYLDEVNRYTSWTIEIDLYFLVNLLNCTSYYDVEIIEEEYDYNN